MKKKLVLIVAILMLLFHPSYCVFAKSSINAPMRVAIKKYKHGNYTGCLQDCLDLVVRHPSAIAYYYMAMSYAQAGKKDMAITAYNRALALKPSAQLAEYAATGKRCLETPDQCHPESKDTAKDDAALDKMIAAPRSDELAPSVVKDYRQIRLDNVRQQINNGKEMDDYSFRKLNFKRDKSNLIAQKPTNDQIVAALKILKDAGLSPYPQEQVTAVTASTTPKADVQVQNSQVESASAQVTSDPRNSDLSDLNMLMGGNNQSNNSNNAALNMIPYMLAQNKNGTANYSPQVMQTIIMNSMMSSYNWDVDNNKDK